jgi:hypothetical protein
MDKAELAKSESKRAISRRVEEMRRLTAWRKKFRGEQAAAIEKARVMLKSKSLSRPEWDQVYDALHNKLGPRSDQIKRIDKIWKKGKEW